MSAQWGDQFGGVPLNGVASTKTPTPTTKAQAEAHKQTWLNPTLQTAGGFLGAILGGAGGAGLGALVPGADLTGIPEAAGAYGGGVGGAGIGAGMGNQAADTINSLVAGQKPSFDMPGNTDAATTGAVAEGVGLPIAKGLGFMAHPIEPFVKMVDKRLAESPAMIDMSQALQTFKDTKLPQLYKKMYGQEATDASNQLATDVTHATSAYQPHIAADGNMPPGANISDMNLPVSDANQVKRDVMQRAKDWYGQNSGQADIEAKKMFGNVLKTAIEQAVPAVQAPNAIASALHTVPDVASGLGQMLSFGNPAVAKSLRMVEGAPVKAIQKVIPGDGGYLNQVIPRLLQFLSGQSAQ